MGPIVATCCLAWTMLGLTPAAPLAPPRDAVVQIDGSVDPGFRRFAEERKDAAFLWLGRLSGNGQRDVLIYIPPRPAPGKRFRLVYHFHGTFSEHVEKPGPGKPKKQTVGWTRLEQTLDAARELQAQRDYNVVLIYPQSAGRRIEPEHEGWSNAQYDRMWMRAESFERLHAEVSDRLAATYGLRPSAILPRVWVEGHSAGGMALRNIALAGSPTVETYLFLDASFQGWADGCYAATRASPSPANVLLVVTINGMADALGRWKPWCLDLERDAREWQEHRSWCEQHAQKPPGASLDCVGLERRGQEWTASGAWCEAMKHDFSGWPGVSLYRTRVRHGDQPRRFTGGLELPPALRP